ncbi:hypothetical protein KDA_15240 [Dictyobacter alpinus]|uniref:Uncharacterized protein n=1 Tax=Dictyobacter alpinus TaxID=2014873 RepID=A0A402B3V9_9CHLR|nr:hypothetical protein [Dictyobacter alpinus]GCE26040.1 hypothetical protein KDA_15240 [Dictyobacter alpinus]
MSASMDGNRKIQEESGPYIWLRYATQYTKDGRTHTIEMSVPVPPGASAEERERLILEAEAGMQQLTVHMDQHLPETSGSGRSQNGQQKNRPAPQPQVNTRTAPAQQQQAAPPRTTLVPGNRPASIAAPPTATQSGDNRNGDAPEITTGGRSGEPGNKSNTGNLSLPAGEPGSNMPLPQFIQYIKDNLDLTPKQAMEMLNVRSLTTGINLRDALEQIKEMLGQNGPAPTSLQAPTRRDSETHLRSEQAQDSSDLPRAQKSGQLPRILRPERDNPIVEMRIPRAAPAGFEEEIGPDELEHEPLAGSTFNELEDLPLLPDEFSEQELERARTKISSLRESQGAATASPQRQKVLDNVVLSQISDEQLRTLIEGVWTITTIKKLKVDQVEALISWAKLEDDFIEQVEAVLAVLEEER